MLSLAHYSLRLGQGALVTYDFEGFEKQFIEQFIQQKPLIIAEHLHFEFKRDACKSSVFEKLRFKVKQASLAELIYFYVRKFVLIIYP